MTKPTMALRMRPISLPGFLMLVLALLLLGACSSTPRRVYPPAASIQQLSVDDAGNWTLHLRLQNYSTVPMRFDALRLAITVGDADAGTLQASPALVIGPGSADVFETSFVPTPAARIAVADTLARRATLAYTLDGQIDATPEDKKKPRQFDVDTRNTLNPAPGLPGVLR